MFSFILITASIVIIVFVIKLVLNRFYHPKKLKIDMVNDHDDLEQYGYYNTPSSLTIPINYKNENYMYNRQRLSEKMSPMHANGIPQLTSATKQYNLNTGILHSNAINNLVAPPHDNVLYGHTGNDNTTSLTSGMPYYNLPSSQSQTIQIMPYPIPVIPESNNDISERINIQQINANNNGKKIDSYTIENNNQINVIEQPPSSSDPNNETTNINKVPFNPFLRKLRSSNTSLLGVTENKIIQAQAQRFVTTTPVMAPFDKDSLQESIFLEEYSIPWEEIEIKNVIGEGAYGKVYKGRWRGTPVAIKVLNSKVDSNIVDDFKEEVYLLSSLRHPNISLFLAACLSPDHLALVTELASRGSLWDVIHTYTIPISLRLKVHISLDIAYGMAYLHSRKPPLLHRDLKSANILVDNSFRAKITDFGLARVKAKTELMTGNCGTYQWMAPEVLDNKKYTEKADIYSYGILLWELYERKLPYEGKTGIQAAVGVLKRGIRPHIPSDCPQEYALIMKMCWNTDPLERPSFPVIIQKLESLYNQLLEEEDDEEEEEEENEEQEEIQNQN